MTRHLITSAIPYINGIKHLGNLIGSQLPADLFARYQRARGAEVMFVCATDEHGTPAELAAAKAGLPVADFCAQMHEVQADIARRFGLSFDHFGRSSSPQNHRLTQHFAGRLAENGLIAEVSERQVYSNADGRFLPDRYIEGTCPNCGYDKARGDQCENCTKQLDPTDLINPHSAISGSSDLEVRETKHLYLRQSALRDELSDWIDSKADWPILTTSIAKKWLNDGDGLRDRGITRDLDWGIIKSFNYLTYDGGQFSTSQGRGVFMDQALSILPADYWRWWLLSHAPEGSDAEFTWDNFQTSVNKDLADVLGNFVSRITKFCRSKFGEVVPEGGDYGPEETALIDALSVRIRAYAGFMEAMEIRKASAELRAIWVLGNEYLQSAAPWSTFKTDEARAAMQVRLGLNLIRLYAVLSQPFIPFASDTMLAAMKTDDRSWPDDTDAALRALPPGHAFEVPEVMFAKISDEAREEWQERFRGVRD